MLISLDSIPEYIPRPDLRSELPGREEQFVGPALLEVKPASVKKFDTHTDAMFVNKPSYPQISRNNIFGDFFFSSPIFGEVENSLCIQQKHLAVLRTIVGISFW